MESLAKISPPVVRNVVARTRLFRWCDQARARPIIWVEGPPGAGKTTLVASYLKARKLPHLWYQLDEGDGDPATFFHYLGLLARSAAPRDRRPLPHLTPEYLGGLPTFSRRFFRDFCGRLRRRHVVVFDNYQAVASDSKVHELLHEGSGEMPEGLNLIIISRDAPLPIWARRRANRALTCLDRQALRLSIQETGEMLRLLQSKQTRTEARRVHMRADGWAAGVVLLTEGSSPSADHTASTAKDATEGAVFDYFAAETFARTDATLQDFMMRTSFLPRITIRAAEDLTGNPNAALILQNLHEHNHFTQQHAASDPFYQYHALFRDFLQARARRDLTGDALGRTRRAAGSLIEAGGDIDTAAELFRDAGEWDELGRIITQHAPRLMAQGRNQTLDHWLNALPAAVRARDPWLQYWSGVNLLLFNPAGARAVIESAYRGFKEREDAAGQFLAWSGVIDTFVHEWDDFHPIDAWIDELKDLMMRVPAFPGPEIEARVAASMTSALVYRMPYHPAIAEWRDRAWRLAQASADPAFRALSSYHVVIHFFWTGQIARGTAALAHLQAFARTHPGFPRIIRAFLESVALWLSGSASVEAAEACVENAREAGVHAVDHLLLTQPVYAALSEGRLGEARRWLDTLAVALEQKRRLDAAHYHFLAGWECLCRGDAADAWQHMQASFPASVDMGTPFPEGLNRIAMSSVCAARGDFDAAQSHARRALDIGRQMDSHLLVFAGSLAEANFRLRKGDEDAGLAALAGALAYGRAHGLRTYPWCSATIGFLCTAAIRAGIEVPYVHVLMRAHNVGAGETPPAELEDWPWSLKVYTLGRFTVVRDGKTLRFSRKAQDRPVALLKAIIALGGRDVAEDRLVDALWPAADGHRAHRALATNLHRLRKLIGRGDAIVLTGRRVSLDARLVWVDAWAFERLLGRAETAERAGDDDEAARLAERALRHYQGQFLGKNEAADAWAAPLRERLHARSLRHLQKLGQRFEAAGEWQTAAESYERGLAVDDLAEELSRRLMICYDRLGRRGEALAVYRRCSRALRSVFGASPSPQTEAIRRSLLS